MNGHKHIQSNQNVFDEEKILSTVIQLFFRYGRADAMALGKFSVNLSNCPPSTVYSDLLHHLLSNLVTQVSLPISAINYIACKLM